jgi:hypothetical protein
VRRAFLITLTAATVACGSTLRELDSQASASATPSPQPSIAAAASAAPNCDLLALVAPAPAPPLAILDLGNGTKKITSAQAGYSIVVPSSWLATPGLFSSPAFGQAHLTSYDPKAIDQSQVIAYGRMFSPDVGIRLDIELWLDPKSESAEDFVKNVHIGPDQSAVLPGRTVTIAGQRAYHTTIQDEFRFQPTTGPLEVTRQTRLLWLVPVLRPDRMLVIYATPGESALRARVEAAVATLQLSQPVVSRMPVTYQRDAILRRWLLDEKTGAVIAGRRVGARLMTYAEASVAMNGGTGLYRIDRDPDELFWLVAVAGPDLPQGRGGSRQSSPAPVTWIEYQTPATNDRYDGTGTRYSTTGTWPPDFDTLPDRCR